jgi:hypothetical protein
MNGDTPSPEPAARRAEFRKIACPSGINCDKLKSLIHHSLSVFEEHHDDVSHRSFILVFFTLLKQFMLLMIICAVFSVQLIQSQVLGLLERNHPAAQSGSTQEPVSVFRAPMKSQTRVVHLLPIPDDEGCSHYFGTASSTFRHSVSSNFSGLASSLNSGVLVVQESDVEAAATPPQFRRQQSENFEVQWQILNLKFPPPPVSTFHFDFNGLGTQFRPALPNSAFLARQTASQAAGGVGFKKMTKSQRKRAKQREKLAQATVQAALAQGVDFLSPCDVSRVRLFLCYHGELQPDGSLPAQHLEINAHRTLAESISEFESKFSAQRLVLPADRPLCLRK